MKLNVKSLSVLLVVQLLLALGIFYGKQLTSTSNSEDLIVNQALGEIKEISITDDLDSSVQLLFRDNEWLITNENDFPADSDKISNFLESINSLSSQSVSAVAVTEGARNRFKVADSEFSKRIKLTSVANTSEELYLGSSPGLDRVHIRKGGEDGIFVVKFPTYEASSSSSSWLDKSILQVPSSDIVYIKTGDIILERKSESGTNTSEEKIEKTISELNLMEGLGSWQATKSDDQSRPLNQEAAREITKQIERLRFTNLSDIDQYNKLNSEEVLVLILQLQDETEIKYILNKHESNYYLRTSDWDRVFSIGSYTAERLLESVSKEVLFPAEALAPNEE